MLKSQCAAQKKTMNNYFGYFCGIYEICFKSGNSFHNEKSSVAITQSKFYNPPVTALNIYSTGPNGRPLSARNRDVKFHKSEWDVVPKTCAGDWVMRYTENETNFNPWQFNQKFSHFELVPWRQQNKQIDLTNAIGWEPFQLADFNEQLKKLRKFELKRSKRLLKRRIKLEKKRIKRHIKIRFIFSFELRRRKMKLFNKTTKSLERRQVTYRDRRFFIFDKNCFNLSEHWGYFSQRNKGVEELLVNNGQALQYRQQRSIGYWPNNALPPPIESASAMSVFEEVPCGECQDRWVKYEISIIELDVFFF